jgi:large subunit ribosomal protein L3
VVRIDAEKNLLLVKGAVPGANGGLLSIEKARRAEKVRVRQETQRSSKKK